MDSLRRISPVAGSMAGLAVLLVAIAVWQNPAAEPADKYPTGPAIPSEWAMQQRLYPHGQAAVDALWQPVQQTVEMRRLAKASQEEAWRLVGPTNIGGRISDIEFNPRNPDTLYASAATGGVFMSSDAGSTWSPIFDDVPVITVGDLGVSPSHPEVLYVGTGEANGGHNNFVGGGVYKSGDGGQTWDYKGLRKTVSIGRVVVHPDDPDVVFVAAIGSYFQAGEDRGLYVTRDGGETWDKSLFISNRTGIIDLVLNPEDPDLMYAAAWERERKVDQVALSGPESGVYRSRDGGETWERLGITSGLPQTVADNVPLGRIGLAVSARNPDRMFALITDGFTYGGLYKSDDRGEAWFNADPDADAAAAFGGFSWYMGRVGVHPDNPDRVWVLDVGLASSSDAGESFNVIFSNPNLHVDNHAIAFHPTDSSIVVVGNDGGISVSTDVGATWERVADLPITQFYEICIDPHVSGGVMGGTQDNGTIRSAGELANWKSVLGGDGMYCGFDPDDPEIFYAESQVGNLVRRGEDDLLTSIVPEGMSQTRNWSTPFAIDPFDSKRLYFAGQQVWRSADSGDNWEVISPVLPKGLLNATRLGTATVLAPSSLEPGVVWAATDDGNIWITQDDGVGWVNVSAGLPDRWVTRVAPHPTSPGAAVATYSGLRWADPESRVYKTDDYGTSWTDISAGLPDAPVNAAVIHPLNGTIYVGLDVGPFYSEDDGNSWAPLGTGMPMVSVYDMKISEDGQTLYAGTHGRSMYALNVGVPVATEPSLKAEDVTLFPNPGVGRSRLDLQLDASSDVVVHTYDVQGRRVGRQDHGVLGPGGHRLTWEASGLPSGMYFVVTELDGKPAASIPATIVRK